MLYAFSSNDALVEYLIEFGALRSSEIIDAFYKVDRADFVGYADSSDIYGDYPLQIGAGQTISQPSTVAKMLEMLAPKEGEKILDIGSGSGWTTALLASIAGEKGLVIGLERVGGLVKFGRGNLKKYGFKNVEIMRAGAKLGLANQKFDRILVSAAADEFPNELASQLKTGGKLVIPIENYIYEVTKKDDDKLEILKHYGYRFVPLIFEK